MNDYCVFPLNSAPAARALITSLLFMLFLFSSSASDFSVDERCNDLLKEMTLKEKISLLSGNDMDTDSVERLGIPSLKMVNGPSGVAESQSSCFPCPMALSATWDLDLVNKVAGAIAKEAKAKEKDILLAPCLSIERMPLAGRNFESFGEDPYLASRLAVSYIKGLQEEGVFAAARDYVCDNQECDRDSVDVRVEERALREIYLPPFEAAVKEGGVRAIMTGRNKVNGFYCTKNSYLLNDVLKREWGFEGVVISGWGATRDAVKSANAGLDIEIPRRAYFDEDLLDAVKTSKVKESAIDDKVRRILRMLLSRDLAEDKQKLSGKPVGSFDQRQTALQAARESVVLLKNKNNTLPLNPNKIRSIAVIGPNAAVNRYAAGGNSTATPFYSVDFLKAIKSRLGDKIAVNYSLGCRLNDESYVIDSAYLYVVCNGAKIKGLLGEYFDNGELKGEPVLRRVDEQIDFDWAQLSPVPDMPNDKFSIRWTGKLAVSFSDKYELSVTSDDGARLYLNGKLLIDNWRDQVATTKNKIVELKTGEEYDLCVEYYENSGLAGVKLGWVRPGKLLDDAIAAAKESDIAIVCVGYSNRYEAEGFDRPDANLPCCQDELIEKVLRVNKNTVVILNNGAPVSMNRWVNKVSAVVEAWYPGQEGGNALADILLGDYNPSGRLPVTFPLNWEDCSAHRNYPGKNDEARYLEGIFVGYRYFDEKEIEVLFPFGYGLSYATFDYRNIQVNPLIVPEGESVEVSFELRNTGKYEGAEVAQLYIRDVKSSAERPPKELKWFQRVDLKPNETKKIKLTLDKRAMSYYDVKKKDWVVEPGEFKVLIGGSSRDIRLEGRFIVRKGLRVNFIRYRNK
ncbi:MAG: glycoside hydrolase family 3 C-terminal domain-containing protein [Candidatus Omnitrophota bacterium]